MKVPGNPTPAKSRPDVSEVDLLMALAEMHQLGKLNPDAPPNAPSKRS